MGPIASLRFDLFVSSAMQGYIWVTPRLCFVEYHMAQSLFPVELARIKPLDLMPVPSPLLQDVTLSREAPHPHATTAKVLEAMDRHHTLTRAGDARAIVELTQGSAEDAPPEIRQRLET